MTAPAGVIGILRYLNDELLDAGDAMARSNRVPQPGPQAHVAARAGAGRALIGTSL